jgi:hypothetical protein
MGRRRWLAVRAAMLLPTIACTAAVDSGSEDEPVGVSAEPIIGAVPAASYSEAAILNIDVPASGGVFWACSAAVIAPRVVLTAGHCVDGHSKWQVVSGTQSRLSTTAVTYDWHENGAKTINPAHHDIGLVFLGSDIALSSYPKLATAPLANGALVTNVGRIDNGALTNRLYEAPGPVAPGTSVGFPFDYAAEDIVQGGDSGGPDFAAGTHTIVAVNSGARTAGEVLARVDLLFGWIQSEIAAHPGEGASASDENERDPARDAGTPPPPPGWTPATSALKEADVEPTYRIDLSR